jgi:hypothetical protein
MWRMFAEHSSSQGCDLIELVLGHLLGLLHDALMATLFLSRNQCVNGTVLSHCSWGR